MDQPPTSRNIPYPIQREVRQRCGFGCVICGMPLYEYEHMEEWAQVKRHVAAEITLLCDQHHREKTSGLLPKEAVRAANSDPYNLRNGASSPYTFHFTGSEATVEIGGNSFTCQDRGNGTFMIPLLVDDTPLIAIVLSDGHFLLSVVIYDECNVPVLHIMSNQLIYSTEPWDIQLIGRTLTLREGPGKILIEFVFCPPNKVQITRGRFLRNGVEVLVRPEHMLITNNAQFISKCSSDDSHGGLIIGHTTKQIGGFLKVPSVSRYLGDRSEALQFARECLALQQDAESP
ncbi:MULTISPECIES: hypothetical protein [unclassified Pseudomonas]|uniref:hypothetical protein n=1 Tax=unclassified Pseudomonas TaxID=196821 RepID=UPI002361F91B|nr:MULTISPECIES: hypothetical protein [unclassified Pseudomonas]